MVLKSFPPHIWILRCGIPLRSLINITSSRVFTSSQAQLSVAYKSRYLNIGTAIMAESSEDCCGTLTFLGSFLYENDYMLFMPLLHKINRESKLCLLLLLFILFWFKRKVEVKLGAPEKEVMGPRHSFLLCSVGKSGVDLNLTEALHGLSGFCNLAWRPRSFSVPAIRQ